MWILEWNSMEVELRLVSCLKTARHQRKKPIVPAARKGNPLPLWPWLPCLDSCKLGNFSVKYFTMELAKMEHELMEGIGVAQCGNIFMACGAWKNQHQRKIGSSWVTPFWWNPFCTLRWSSFSSISVLMEDLELVGQTLEPQLAVSPFNSTRFWAVGVP